MLNSAVTRRAMIGASAAGAAVTAVAASPAAPGEAQAQSARTTFVLVHGASCGGWIWRRVADILERRGAKVYCPTLTGLGERSHLLSPKVDLDTHIVDVANLIEWESLEGVCLVAHSYAGFPVSGALERLGGGSVSSLVLLDAFKPADGERAIDYVGDSVRRAAFDMAARGEAAFAAPRTAGPDFVNASDLAFFLSKATPQPVASYVQPIRLTGAREKVAKKTYIRLTRFPNSGFDRAFAECRADKSWTGGENTASSHCVMLDEPEWVADVLIRAS